jgi:hypothetical protein
MRYAIRRIGRMCIRFVGNGALDLTVVVILLAAVVASACGSHPKVKGAPKRLVVRCEANRATSAGAQADPKAVVLRRADLPSGFESNSSYVTIEEAAPHGNSTVSQYRSFGFERGYGSQLGKGPWYAPLYGISAATNVFRTQNGAERSLAQKLRFIRSRQHSDPRYRHRYSLSERIGDKAYLYGSVGFVRYGSGALRRERFYVVSWRHGNLESSLIAQGREMSVSDAIALAKCEDSRID